MKALSYYYLHFAIIGSSLLFMAGCSSVRLKDIPVTSQSTVTRSASHGVVCGAISYPNLHDLAYDYGIKIRNTNNLSKSSNCYVIRELSHRMMWGGLMARIIGGCMTNQKYFFVELPSGTYSIFNQYAYVSIPDGVKQEYSDCNFVFEVKPSSFNYIGMLEISTFRTGIAEINVINEYDDFLKVLRGKYPNVTSSPTCNLMVESAENKVK